MEFIVFLMEEIEMLDELKEIEEIISKLDGISQEDWSKKDNETEEEYEERIQNLEEDIEEELIDAISDSLLNQQSIDEAKAIEEAEEKINKDYELFSDAFEKNSDGKLKLKSEDELVKLGYDSQDEYRRLIDIENNFNDPEQYYEKIRESIKKKVYIGSEIDRKMELARAIISAKKRGEEYLPETYQKANIGKFIKLNDYIKNTTSLSRVPIIQQEYIRNNTLEENRYVSFVNSLNNVVTYPNATVVTGVANMQATQPIVLQQIPAKKNEVYTYLENKLDKDKDQTKQKILARTELKVFLKNYENKDLDEQESNDLKQKIAEIEQKYPNSITNKVLEKLFDSFKIKLAEEKENSEGKSQGTQGSENEEDSDKNIDSSESGEPTTKRLRNKANDIKNGINGVIDSLKQISTRAIKQITKNPKDDNELEPIDQESKVNIPDDTSQPVQTNIVTGSKSVPMPISAEQEKDKKAIEKTISLITLQGKLGTIDINKLRIAHFDSMICYLGKYDDPEIQAEFNKIINTMDEFAGNDFTDNIDKIDVPFDIFLLEKMYELYRTGVKSDDGKRIILETNINKSRNYLSKEGEYLLHLKKKAETKVDNPIENLKNEAKFIQVLNRTTRGLTITKAINPIILMRDVELIKRNNKKSDRKSLEIEIESYVKKFNNNEKIGNYGLEILGDIFYNGIQATNGDIIYKPDKKMAKAFYEKLLTDNIDYKNPKTYNRLLKLYNEANDKKKANEIKQKMWEKNITEEQSDPIDKTKTKAPCVYVCSDLHGRFSAYREIIEKLKPKDRLYILGDVFDGARENDGVRILKDIMKRQKSGQVEFLIGNHELFPLLTERVFEKLQNNPNLEYKTTDYTNLDINTFNGLKKLTKQELKDMEQFLYNSLVYKQIQVNGQTYYLTHAKAIENPDKSEETVLDMVSNGQEEVLKNAIEYRTKNGDYSQIKKENVLTIVGHTPTKSKQIEYHIPGVLSIDCGISYDDQLALVNLTEGEVQYFNAESIKEKAKSKTKEEDNQAR